MRRHRWIIAPLVPAMRFAFACGGTSSIGPSSACDHYFDVAVAEACSGAIPPSDEIARIKARFERVCTDVLALPGSGASPSQLDACASALQSEGCDASRSPDPQACKISGSLGGGSACVSGFQCASGVCDYGTTISPDGGTSSPACGVCVTPIPAGQPCGFGVVNGSSTCAEGTTCQYGSANPLCVAITYGDVGAACSSNGGAASCKAGLYCDFRTGKCAAQLDQGGACTQGDSCKAPLNCVFTPGSTSTCQSPGQAGATCQVDGDCASGLVCDTTSHCATPSWAGSGQPCSASIHCLVGVCALRPGMTSQVCPIVIADGQPCVTNDSTHTCDTFASCISGTCQLLGSASCH
jgi:hypothetical protein